MNLYDKTLKLIRNKPSDLSLEKITEDLKANDTKVSYSWVNKFSQGLIPNPEYHRLQALHDYLVSKSKQTA